MPFPLNLITNSQDQTAACPGYRTATGSVRVFNSIISKHLSNNSVTQAFFTRQTMP
jgi:hypothetical protein